MANLATRRRPRPRRASAGLPVEALERRRLLSAGDLDPTFGGDGKVTTDQPTQLNVTGWSVAVQADGKVVAAGTATRPDDLYGDFFVARFNADGSLDPTFGGGDGSAVVDFEGRHDVARAVSLAPGNKIVVGGYSAEAITSSPSGAPREEGADFAAARLNPDGSLDRTFDADGMRRVDLGGEDAAADVAVRADGGVYLAGGSGSRSAAAALRADGSPDPAFDGDGIVQLPSPSAGITAAELDANGRLVIASQQSPFLPSAPNTFYLTRLTPNGTVDAAFGTLAVSDRSPFVQDLAIAPDGKIVAAGSFGAMRFSSNGSLDTSFSGDGKADGPFAWAVAVAPDRSVLIAGSPIPAAGAADVPRLARFLPDGTPDPVFNATPAEPAGQVQNGTGAVRGLALTGDGRSVTVGYTSALTPIPGAAPALRELVLTRRLPNGALDPSFAPGGDGGDGVAVLHASGPGTNSVADVVALPGGKVLALGTTTSADGADLVLARYNADGSPDATFGAAGTGIVTAGDEGRTDSARSLLVQDDGKILVAAYSRRPAGGTTGDVQRLIISRYDADGRPDVAFGTGGRVVILTVDGQVLATPLQFTGGTALAQDPDGRILIATTISGTRLALVRLLADGAFDPTLGANGMLPTAVSGTAAGVAVAPLGKIVVAVTSGAYGGWAVARFMPDGTRDIQFQQVQGSTGVPSYVGALAVAPGGEVLVGGTSGAPPGNPTGASPPRDLFLARYNAVGRPDTTYGNNGMVITDLGGDEVLGDLVLLPDNSVVVAGATRPQNLFETRSAGDFVVARYTLAGAPDPTFGGGDGVATVDFNGAGDAASAVAVGDDGRIVAAGQAYVAGRSFDMALARLDGGGPVAPNVEELSVGGSAFSPSFRAYLNAYGVGGGAGFVLQNGSLAPGNPAILLSQVAVNQVSARLSRSGSPDLLGADDLRVRGVNVADYGVSGVAYDPATRLATWTLARPVENDRVAVEINPDADAAFELRWRVDVLGGDADGNGQVNALDIADIKRRLGKVATLPVPLNPPPSGYGIFADVTGDGRINALDLAAAKQRLTRRLPSGPPPQAGAALAPESITRELLGSPK